MTENEIAALDEMMYFMHHTLCPATHNGPLYIRDGGAKIMTRKEFKALLPRLLAFYKEYDDEAIAELQARRNPERWAGCGSVRQKKPAKPGYVYLIESQGKYKIGIAVDVRKRFHNLQISAAHSLTLIHTIVSDNQAEDEAYWHNRFAHKHERGEWFALDTDDVAEFCKVGAE